jgi:hypothetical protein
MCLSVASGDVPSEKDMTEKVTISENCDIHAKTPDYMSSFRNVLFVTHILSKL